MGGVTNLNSNITNNNITEDITQEITTQSEMNIPDLININNKHVERQLRETEGLLWHYRLNHPSLSQMHYLKQEMPELKNVVLHDDIKHCIHCRLAKAKKLPFGEERTPATRILEKVKLRHVHFALVINIL